MLRFYGWTEPAATFGYFQKYAEVERATLLRPLIRRPTGGGIVPHDADWTYSLAFPPGHEWHSLKAEESYRRVHEWIQAAFARLNVATELAPCCRKVRRPANVSSATKNPICSGTARKIAGAAQRRNKLGLLIQGSVQPPPVAICPDRLATGHGRCRTRRMWGWSGRILSRTRRCAQRAESLVRKKFSQPEFITKR